MGAVERTKDVLFKGLGVVLSAFLFYTAGFGQFPLPWQRGLPLAIVAVMILLRYPIVSKESRLWRTRWFPIVAHLVDAVLIVGIVAATYYIIKYAQQIALNLGRQTPVDILFSLIGIIVVLEITRRTSPWALTVIVLVALAYGAFGDLIPGRFGHVGYSWPELGQYLFLSYDGIYGVALGAMVGIVYVFVLLGSFLEFTGAGKAFIDLAYGLTGRMQGGPALSSVVASSLFGTVSGSAVANVVGTGTFTIPLMKRTGFAPAYAGAVEATASTGGMIMPPVMGAAAFLMAEVLGVPYMSIVKMALIPALLYYISLFTSIYFRSSKENLKGLSDAEVPEVRRILAENWPLFMPLVLLIALLALGFTPPYAAFYSCVALLVLVFVRRRDRDLLRKILDAFVDSASSSLSIFASLAAVGIVIGVVALSGIGVKFSALVMQLAGNNLGLALMMVMAASIIMGMGLPPVACYIILVTFAARALQNLGLDVRVAHMFVFYYGALASITPPVAMASYAAAGIAGADVMRTSWIAVRLGLVGFIVPFMFAYGPALLMMGSTTEILLAAASAVVGVVALAVAGEGYFIGPVGPVARLLLTGAALLAIHPGLHTDLIGYAVIGTVLVSHWLVHRKATRSAAANP